MFVNLDMGHVGGGGIALYDGRAFVCGVVVKQYDLIILESLIQHAVNPLAQIAGVVIVGNDNTNRGFHR